MVIVAGQRLCCALKQIIFGPSNTLVNILRQIWSPKKVNFQNFAVGCQVNVNFDILYLKMILKKKSSIQLMTVYILRIFHLKSFKKIVNLI